MSIGLSPQNSNHFFFDVGFSSAFASALSRAPSSTLIAATSLGRGAAPVRAAQAAMSG